MSVLSLRTISGTPYSLCLAKQLGKENYCYCCRANRPVEIILLSWVDWTSLNEIARQLFDRSHLLLYKGPGIDERTQLLEAFLEVIVQDFLVRYLVLQLQRARKESWRPLKQVLSGEGLVSTVGSC